MGLTVWTREGGTDQGRIVPTGWVPRDGSYVVALGSDQPGRTVTINAGEFVSVSQTGDFGAGAVLRMAARLRHVTPPVGTTWVALVSIDGGVVMAREITRDRDLQTIGCAVADLAGDHTVEIGLLLLGTGGPFEAELPAFYVDALVLDTTPDTRPALFNLDPEPGERGAPLDTNIMLDIADWQVGGTVDIAFTKVYVNGQLALDGGVFQAGWDGPASAVETPQADTKRITIDPTTPFTSEEQVSVRVLTRYTGAVVPLDTTYTWTAADTTPPAIVSAVARGQRTLRVQWDGDVTMADAAGTDDALNPANYVIDRPAGVAAVSLAVTAVAAVDPRTVDITMDIEMTGGAAYTVTAWQITDAAGNVSVAPTNARTFTGYVSPRPADREWSLYGQVPQMNRTEDVSGDLYKFLSISQEILDNVIFPLLDGFPDVADPDVCAEEYVDAMLADLGNPFGAFDLTLARRRQLVQSLVLIYGEKGTDPGIVNAIRFLLGIEVTVVPIGFSTPLEDDGVELGHGWVLDSSDLRDRLSFDVVCDTALTDEQIAMITSIARYMRWAPTHLNRVRAPTPPEDIDHLELGLSQLGVSWILH